MEIYIHWTNNLYLLLCWEHLIISFQGEINGKLHYAQLWTQEHRKAVTSPRILKYLNDPTKILSAVLACLSKTKQGTDLTPDYKNG